MLGEATHGTHEFYLCRSLITQLLIKEHGFAAVAVEADWPNAARVTNYLRGRGEDADAVASLGDFSRFPQWMWRNCEVVELIEALRAVNDSRPTSDRVGFYGLDLYSLYSSIESILAYLQELDPAAAEAARQRYGCLQSYDDPQEYGAAIRYGFGEDCENEAVTQLMDLQNRRASLLSRDGTTAEDAHFFAERNATVVKNAEAYYRLLYQGGVNTWNLRDQHMFDTLAALREHLGGANIVVWAHNSHLGDARATGMSDRGELNLGQLAREAWGEAAALVGFTTSTGHVAAADDWDGPVRHQTLNPPLPGSVERLLSELVDRHDGPSAFALEMADDAVRETLGKSLLERAVGVIYRPQTERQSHYFRANVAEQFDWLLHFERTSAVSPLDRPRDWEPAEPHAAMETYPTGL